MSTPSDARAVAEQIDGIFDQCADLEEFKGAMATYVTARESEADARGYARGKAEGEQKYHHFDCGHVMAKIKRGDGSYQAPARCGTCVHLATARAEGKAEALREAEEERAVQRGQRCPLRPVDATNPYVASCGTWFDSYEEMAHHEREHETLRQRAEGQGSQS